MEDHFEKCPACHATEENKSQTQGYFDFKKTGWKAAIFVGGLIAILKFIQKSGFL
jgi:hypothetical protein